VGYCGDCSIWNGTYCSTIPVDGSRISLEAFPPVKSKRPFSVPALTSEELPPMRPRSQLSSMKRRTEDWSR
jgi:hypothetical protein